MTQTIRKTARHAAASVLRNHFASDAAIRAAVLDTLSGINRNYEWVSLECGCDLFSRTCSTYRVARTQQLELPKQENAVKPETEGSVPVRKQGTWTVSANWYEDQFDLSLPFNTDNPTFTRAEAARIHEALERFLGTDKQETNNMTPQRAKELLPVIQAFAEGKTIQYRFGGTGDWQDCSAYVEFVNGGVYRIKPEPKWRMWTAKEVPVGGRLVVPVSEHPIIVARGLDYQGRLWVLYPTASSVSLQEVRLGTSRWYWPHDPSKTFPVGVLEELES